jgi:hypothetical protein
LINIIISKVEARHSIGAANSIKSSSNFKLRLLGLSGDSKLNLQTRDFINLLTPKY